MAGARAPAAEPWDFKLCGDMISWIDVKNGDNDKLDLCEMYADISSRKSYKNYIPAGFHCTCIFRKNVRQKDRQVGLHAIHSHGPLFSRYK